ncbi:hypothetical protein [Saccharicrinis fermentans]|uniref:Auto-transporter adhesin head GIN domain-containing protein n=1 Tax=Saccharicrinis fermentans DSM 9555 = JCM 21142 TaxID=869213 RepID=W7YAY4_9BACT|nr:hypothetical protein [Saccharicrinis fermentans]GAF05557.1 hypothetical protein JCM21142_104297 [Saccharicrinis fermentans DSM 9555 = JCM 21142]
MKCLFVPLLLSINFTIVLHAQEFEWNVKNTGSKAGERIVAVLDAGTIGRYTGVAIIGQIVDNNGNWGYNLPSVSDFKLYVRFSGGLAYDLVQNEKTSKIILGLRKITDSKIHLIANCPYNHMAMRINLIKVAGGVDITLGDPDSVVVEGEQLMSEPRYEIDNLYVDGSGNVSIGNTSPQAKLHVSGDILAEEIRVEDIAANNLNLAGNLAANNIIVTANGETADFVFADDYHLAPLSEVENYILTHKHLPGIPNAIQMEEQGVNLAEMNKLLLQKVEELVLYQITKEKEVKRLEAEIESLEEEKRKGKEKLDEVLSKGQRARKEMVKRLAKLEKIILSNK